MKTSLSKAKELVDAELGVFKLRLMATDSVQNIRYYHFQMRGYLRALNDYNVLSDIDYEDYNDKARELK